MWARLPAFGIVAFLCACAPSQPPAAPGRAVPPDLPVAARHDQAAAHHYASVTDPRPRQRPAARRFRQHRETQQARADSVNPPFDAGE
jgi:hypothetical protein